MAAYNADYPYPVLQPNSDDYTESCIIDFTFIDDVIVDESKIVAHVKYELSSTTLRNQVENSKATAIVQVKCPSASFSSVFEFPSDSNTLTVGIEKDRVVDRIDYSVLIVAAGDYSIDGSDKELNQQYFANMHFQLRKGDTLARSDVRSVYIDDSELEKPISSIFSVCYQEGQEEAIVPDYDGERIRILLRPDLCSLYHEFAVDNNGMLDRYATAAVVLPVLVEAVSKVCFAQNQDQDIIEERRWYRAIQKKVEALTGNDATDYQDSPVTLANKLLGEINLHALKQFKETIDSELDNGQMEIVGGAD